MITLLTVLTLSQCSPDAPCNLPTLDAVQTADRIAQVQRLREELINARIEMDDATLLGPVGKMIASGLLFCGAAAIGFGAGASARDNNGSGSFLLIGVGLAVTGIVLGIVGSVQLKRRLVTRNTMPIFIEEHERRLRQLGIEP